MRIGLLVLIATLTACDPLECGEGTSERGGACVPADSVSPDDPQCGDGTVFDPVAQACVPELPPTECGPNTEPIEREDGVIECVGTGTSCADPLPCPLPTGAAVSVCGRLIDTETSAPIAAGDGTDTSLCDPDNPTADGPCSLTMTFLDAIEFATGGGTPLVVGTLEIDSCGRYRAIDISTPASNFLGIAIDDGQPGPAGEYVVTGIGLAVADGLRLDDTVLVATRRSTDQAWTTSAGDPFGGATFSETGAVLVTYLDGMLPVAGVEITVDGAAAPDADDFYFDDANPAVKSSVAAGQDATGINGGGLVVGTMLVDHSGSGAEPPGCTWQVAPAVSIPNVIFATRRVAVCP